MNAMIQPARVPRLTALCVPGRLGGIVSVIAPYANVNQDGRYSKCITKMK